MRQSIGQNMEKLDDLRRDIDGIDEALHDLLIRRAELTRATAAAKIPAGASTDVPALAIRPAREAQILRRLLTRHRGDLPRRVIVRIWREIIAASLQAQTEFQVHVYVGENQNAFVDLAHAHFGSLTPLRGHNRASVVVSECAEVSDSLGVVPMPELERDGVAWWAQLAAAGQAGPRVIGKLPFIVHPEENQPLAYVIGAVEHEPSGEDTTLLRVESRARLSRTRLGTLLGEVGIETQLVSASQASGRDGQSSVLLAAKGFIAPSDPRLAAFRARAGESVSGLDLVGGYADPVVLAPKDSR